ncbi:MAG: hypothetical protein MUE44_04755 [Oscillatoriaceae cyanobacterium Prado104]|nr:hypothetical protein [Oscillatoriaceae cyanobacterium Prado104]
MQLDRPIARATAMPVGTSSVFKRSRILKIVRVQKQTLLSGIVPVFDESAVGRMGF